MKVAQTPNAHESDCLPSWNALPPDVKRKIGGLLDDVQLKALRLVSREDQQIADACRSGRAQALATAWDNARAGRVASSGRQERTSLAMALGQALAEPGTIVGIDCWDLWATYFRLQATLHVCAAWPAPGVELEHLVVPETAIKMAERATFAMAWPTWAQRYFAGLCARSPMFSGRPPVLSPAGLATLFGEENLALAVTWGFDQSNQPFCDLRTRSKLFRRTNDGYILADQRTHHYKFCRFRGEHHLSIVISNTERAVPLNPAEILPAALAQVKTKLSGKIEICFYPRVTDFERITGEPHTIFVEHLDVPSLDFTADDANNVAQLPPLWPIYGDTLRLAI